MLQFTPSPHPRGHYRLTVTQWVERPQDEVFDFFADTENLERITPPWLRFQILTPSPITMRIGCEIDYRLRLHTIPIRWTSVITVWEPQFRFVDEQLRGPFRFWHHDHRIEQVEGGAQITDIVDYTVPGGGLVNRLLVRGDLQKIFRYRQRQIQQIFGEPAETTTQSSSD